MRFISPEVLYVLGLCFLMSSCAGPDAAPLEKPERDVAAVSVEDKLAAYHAGKQLYMTHCYFCHGKSADGKGPLAASLEGVQPRDFRSPAIASAHPDSLKRVILEGGAAMGLSETMPAWNSTLTPADADMLVAFIQVVSKEGGLLLDIAPMNPRNLTGIPTPSQPAY